MSQTAAQRVLVRRNRPGRGGRRALVTAVVAVVGVTVLAPVWPAAASGGRGKPPPAQRTPALPHRDVPLRPHAPAPGPVDLPRAATAWPAAADADVTFPAAGSGTAPLPDAAAPAPKRAGGLPVLISRTAPRRAASPPAAYHVHLADQEVARKSGVSGVLLTVTAGAATGGSVSVGVDYTTFRNAGGAGWATRLHLVRLPACALTTPAVRRCQVQTPITSSNDAAAGVVSADVAFPARRPAGSATSSASPAGGGMVVLAAVAGPAGSNGAFTASSLAPSGTWSVSTASGAFTWSYPIAVPPAASGTVAPKVALAYDSSGVDGRIASTNNQPSWIGEGFDYSPGYIERTYRSCADDPAGTAPKTYDLCWAGPVVTASFGGQSTSLVQDDTTHGWRASADNGERVELLTGAGNGANSGEYWKITTTDGTQYFFGREYGPGRTTQATTNSTWTAPVYGAHSGDPCYDAAGFGSSSCAQAWRWNLDYVEDPHGNVATYYYTKETNYYGANGTTTGVPYTRGGALDHIDYGQRDENGSIYAAPAPDQVRFGTAERCTPSGSITCDPSQFTATNAASWPDTPQDQQCLSGVTCNNHAPTFWSTRRLTSITTQYYNGTGYTRLDTYTLAQSFPTAGDPELWLNSVTRTGYAADGTSIGVPPISFAGQLMDNRVSGYNSQPPMLHWRLTSITTETGSIVAVNYSQRECTDTHVPADPANDSMRCFPVYWTLPYQTTPTLDYFHKYLTTEVDVQDPNALSPTQITAYTYLGAPAWHLDDNEVIKPTNRTYGQFRGYAQVEVRTGNPGNSQGGVPDARTQTTTTYFRGMNGAPVTDSLGETVTDNDAYTDTAREVRTLTGDGGTQVSTTITDPATLATTASRARSGLPALTARITATTRTRRLTNLAAGGVRTTTATYGYDNIGRPIHKTDSGDGVPNVCTTTSYAENTTSWIRDRIAETITSQQACPPAGTPPAPLLTDVRTYYDGSTTLGAITAAGDVTRTETATDDTGGSLHFAAAAASYDITGRPKTSTVYTTDSDTVGRTTTLTYTPADGGPLTQIVTANAKNQATTTVLDPGRGTNTESIDVAGHKTDATYDQLGRLTAVWRPGQARGFAPATTTYDYLLRSNGPPAVTRKALVDSGAATNPLNYATTVTLYDALGQPRQTQTDAEGGGRVVADTFYDSHGWPVRTNNRWYTSGAPATTLVSTADSAVNDRTLTTYDGNGRPVLSTAYNGLTATWNTRTIYGGDRTTVIPPAGGVTTTALTDARGHTTQIRQYTTAPTIAGDTVTGGTYQTTAYHYTPLGQQDSLTDPDGRTWTVGYDLAGRTTSQTDPDAGNSTHTYNNAGDLTSTTDGRGQSLAYDHDALGRKTAEYAGSTTGTKLASWTWDTVQTGKLTSTTRFTPTGNYLSGVSLYNGNGDPGKVVIQIPASETGLAGTYTTTYSYTATGQPNGVKPAAGGGLPGEGIGTSYTTLGHPASTSGYNDYVDSTTYTPYGEPAQHTLGDSTSHAWITYDRDPQTRRITDVNLSAQTVQPQLDDLTYSYDPAGNITHTTNVQGPPGSSARTQCYNYDALARLSQAWTATDNCAAAPTAAPGSANIGGPNPYWTTWALDPAGLRTSQTQHALPGATGDTTTTYDYTAGATQPHTLSGTTTNGPTGTTTTGYGYDAAGNTTTRTLPGGNQNLTWDTENRLATDTTPAGDTSYVYDGNGTQLIRHDPGSTTLYLPGEELTRNTTTGIVTGTRYYTHNGTTIAVRVGNTDPIYLLADQHGTNQIAVKSYTYALTRRTFDPYGNPLGATTGGTWPDTHGYLDKPADATTGLTDVGARKYDPTTGRFISVDPILNPNDPQSLNGYTYADDNPVTNSDPTGLLCANGPDGMCWNPTTGQNTPTPGVSDRQGATSPQGGGGHSGDHAPFPGKTTDGYIHVAYGSESTLLPYAGQIDPNKVIIDPPPQPTDDQSSDNCGGSIWCFQQILGWHWTSENYPLLPISKFAMEVSGFNDCARRSKIGCTLAVAAWAAPEAGALFRAYRAAKAAETGEAAATTVGRSAARSCLNSFPGDTPVTMAGGTKKPISQVKVGDKVIATDPQTGETAIEPVVALIRHAGTHRMVKIHLIDGSTLTSTDGHPIWEASAGQFTNAGDLHVGDKVETDDGSLIEITGLTPYDAVLTAYNLQVGNIHTYYAGVSPILVHNACDFLSRPSQIADRFGVSTRDVKDAIHAVKNNLPRGGPVRNPDVVVDPVTGEVYPQLPGGGFGDSIGNILDHLPGSR